MRVGLRIFLAAFVVASVVAVALPGDDSEGGEKNVCKAKYSESIATNPWTPIPPWTSSPKYTFLPEHHSSHSSSEIRSNRKAAKVFQVRTVLAFHQGNAQKGVYHSGTSGISADSRKLWSRLVEIRNSNKSISSVAPPKSSPISKSSKSIPPKSIRPASGKSTIAKVSAKSEHLSSVGTPRSEPTISPKSSTPQSMPLKSTKAAATKASSKTASTKPYSSSKASSSGCVNSPTNRQCWGNRHQHRLL